jgi:hypothetical protein
MAVVLMTGVLSAARATRLPPAIAPLIASAEPRTRSNRSRSERASSTTALADSVELLERSGLPAEALTIVGVEHRLHDEAATKAMFAAVIELAGA